MGRAAAVASIEPVTETELEVRQAGAALPEAPGRPGPASRSGRVTVIRPSSRVPRLDLGELWHYRELLGIFVWRDLKVRYKQTLIGIAWALFQPTFTALIYVLVLGKFGNFPSGNLPYPILTLSGLLITQYFSTSVTQSSNSIVSGVNLVTKVYFPRVLMPTSSVIVPLVDLALGCVVLVGVMAWFGIWPQSLVVLLAPAFVLLALVTALGIGLFLSAVNVRFRDVPYVIPVFLQVLPFISGAVYALSSLPEKWQWILSLNPVTGVISGWRWTILDAPPPDPGKLALSVGMGILLLLGGIAYFQRSEPRFADTI
jgi:lipopolysaccharide transport system permease protein